MSVSVILCLNAEHPRRAPAWSDHPVIRDRVDRRHVAGGRYWTDGSSGDAAPVRSLSPSVGERNRLSVSRQKGCAGRKEAIHKGCDTGPLQPATPNRETGTLRKSLFCPAGGRARSFRHFGERSANFATNYMHTGADGRIHVTGRKIGGWKSRPMLP